MVNNFCQICKHYVPCDRRHVWGHLDVPLYECSYCGFRSEIYISGKTKVLKHVAICHPEASLVQMVDSHKDDYKKKYSECFGLSMKKNLKIQRCKLCDMELERYTGPLSHIWQCHIREAQFQCSKCSFGVKPSNIHSLQQHIKRHNGKATVLDKRFELKKQVALLREQCFGEDGSQQKKMEETIARVLEQTGTDDIMSVESPEEQEVTELNHNLSASPKEDPPTKAIERRIIVGPLTAQTERTVIVGPLVGQTPVIQTNTKLDALLEVVRQEDEMIHMQNDPTPPLQYSPGRYITLTLGWRDHLMLPINPSPRPKYRPDYTGVEKVKLDLNITSRPSVITSTQDAEKSISEVHEIKKTKRHWGKKVERMDYDPKKERKPFKCKLCGEIIIRKSVHIYQWHMSQPVFRCPLCDFSCTYVKSATMRHIVTKHKKEAMTRNLKPVDCRENYIKEFIEVYSKCFDDKPRFLLLGKKKIMIRQSFLQTDTQ